MLSSVDVNGLVDLYVVGADGYMYQMQQDYGKNRWLDWNHLAGPSQIVKLVASPTIDLNWTLFGMNTNGTLSYSRPFSHKSTWEFLGSGVIDLAVSESYTRETELFTVSKNGTISWWIYMMNNWHQEVVSMNPSAYKVDSIRVAINTLGQRGLFALEKSSNTMWGTLEPVQGWSSSQSWLLLSQSIPIRDFVAFANHGGRFFVLALGDDQVLRFCYQTSVSNFSSWETVRSNMFIKSFTIGKDDAGLTQLYLLDERGSPHCMMLDGFYWRYHSMMTRAARLSALSVSPSTSPVPMDGVSMLYSRSPGTQEVFALAPNHTLYRSIQDHLASWSSWSVYATNVSQHISGEEFGQLYFLDLYGQAYYMIESFDHQQMRRISLGSVPMKKLIMRRYPDGTPIILGLNARDGQPMISLPLFSGLFEWRSMPGGSISCTSLDMTINYQNGFDIFCLHSNGKVFMLSHDLYYRNFTSDWQQLSDTYTMIEGTAIMLPLVSISCNRGMQVGIVGRDVDGTIWTLIKTRDGIWPSEWKSTMNTGYGEVLYLDSDWEGNFYLYFTTMSNDLYLQSTSNGQDFSTSQLLLSNVLFISPTLDPKNLRTIFVSYLDGEFSAFHQLNLIEWTMTPNLPRGENFLRLASTVSHQMGSSQEIIAVKTDLTVLRIKRAFNGVWGSWVTQFNDIKQVICQNISNYVFVQNPLGQVSFVQPDGSRIQLGEEKMLKVMTSLITTGDWWLFGIESPGNALKEWKLIHDGTNTTQWVAMPDQPLCSDFSVVQDGNGTHFLFCIDNQTKSIKYSSRREAQATWDSTWMLVPSVLPSGSSISFGSVIAKTQCNGSLVVYGTDRDTDSIYAMHLIDTVDGQWELKFVMEGPVTSVDATCLYYDTMGVFGLYASAPVAAIFQDSQYIPMIIPGSNLQSILLKKDPYFRDEMIQVGKDGNIVVRQLIAQDQWKVIATLPSLSNVLSVVATNRMD